MENKKQQELCDMKLTEEELTELIDKGTIKKEGFTIVFENSLSFKRGE